MSSGRTPGFDEEHRRRSARRGVNQGKDDDRDEKQQRNGVRKRGDSASDCTGGAGLRVLT